MSEQQSQIVSVKACGVVEIRRFLSFEMSPDQVLAFVSHVEDWLARISHTRPAAASDSGVSAALLVVNDATASPSSSRLAG